MGAPSAMVGTVSWWIAAVDDAESSASSEGILPARRASMARLLTLPALVAVVVVSVVSGGCAAAEEEDQSTGSDDSNLTVSAVADYDKILEEVAAAEKKCRAEKKCSKDGTRDEAAIRTATIRPLDSEIAIPKAKEITEYGFCDALRPLAALESPYFFAGIVGKAATVETIADGGVDLVFDLRNQQASLFHYHSHGYQNLVGVEASVYGGWAFGDKASVIDAWAGTFQTAEASLEVPFLKLSAGGTIFRSPDNSIWGAAAQVGIGLNALGPLSTVTVAASEGEWTPWDAATKSYGDSLWWVEYATKSAKFHGKGYSYLQFEGTKDLALALVETFGILGAVPAAQAAALAVLRSKNLTFKRACPTKE
jgi:hypothetical protein